MGIRLSLAFLAAALSALLGISGVCAATTNVIAWSGMPTSAGASTNEWFTGFSNAAINDEGTVAFNASVTTVSSGLFVIPLNRTVSPSKAATNVVAVTNPLISLPKFTNTWNGIWTLSRKGTSSLLASSGSRSYPMIADIGGFNSLGSPLLNNSNLCAFAGNYSPGFIAFPPLVLGAPITNFYSVYGGQGVWVSTNTWSPVAFVGESAPGYSNPFTAYVGTLSALANLSATNGFQLSTSPILFTNWPSFSSIDRIALPDTGRLLFSATVMATNYYYPQPSSNGMAVPMYVAIQPLLQHGVWAQGSDGTLAPLIREGEPLVVGSSTLTVASIACDPAANLPAGSVAGNPFLFGPRNMDPATGDMAFGARFSDSSYGLLIARAGNDSLAMVAHSGDPVPGGATNERFLSFGNPDINRQGHVAFGATAGSVTPFPIVYAVAKPAAIAGTNPGVIAPIMTLPTNSFTNTWTGIWAEDTNGVLRMIARSAPPVPDIGGFTSFDGIMYNERHQVAFRAQKRAGFIMTPPGSFSGGSGIWIAPDTANPVAWLGQTAPGYPANLTISVPSPYSWSTNAISLKSAAPVFSSFYHAALPNSGHLVLWATAAATNKIPVPPVPRGGHPSTTNAVSLPFRQNGIWMQNSSGSLTLVLREGMTLTVNGKVRTIATIPFVPQGNEPAGGQTRFFNRSTGTIVTPVTFSDGTQAVVTMTP